MCLLTDLDTRRSAAGATGRGIDAKQKPGVSTGLDMIVDTDSKINFSSQSSHP